MNKTMNGGIKVKSIIKAAGVGSNHNRTLAGLKVKGITKAAGVGSNHNRTLARAR